MWRRLNHLVGGCCAVPVVLRFAGCNTILGRARVVVCWPVTCVSHWLLQLVLFKFRKSGVNNTASVWAIALALRIAWLGKERLRVASCVIKLRRSTKSKSRYDGRVWAEIGVGPGEVPYFVVFLFQSLLGALQTLNEFLQLLYLSLVLLFLDNPASSFLLDLEVLLLSSILSILGLPFRLLQFQLRLVPLFFDLLLQFLLTPLTFSLFFAQVIHCLLKWVLDFQKLSF